MGLQCSNSQTISDGEATLLERRGLSVIAGVAMDSRIEFI